jgi:hypothetical protein
MNHSDRALSIQESEQAIKDLRAILSRLKNIQGALGNAADELTHRQIETEITRLSSALKKLEEQMDFRRL